MLLLVGLQVSHVPLPLLLLFPAAVGTHMATLTHTHTLQVRSGHHSPRRLLSGQQPLLDPPLVLLLAPLLLVGVEVNELEGVVEQTLLHLLVYGRVCLEARGEVHLQGQRSPHSSTGSVLQATPTSMIQGFSLWSSRTSKPRISKQAEPWLWEGKRER